MLVLHDDTVVIIVVFVFRFVLRTILWDDKQQTATNQIAITLNHDAKLENLCSRCSCLPFIQITDSRIRATITAYFTFIESEVQYLIDMCGR